jgi:uncharacterized RDD family membrane protein YckC
MSPCPKCGTANAESARFCQSCWQSLSSREPQSEPTAPTPGQVEYIGFWWRVLGAVIDWFVVGAGVAALSTLPGLLLTAPPLSIVVPWLYEALMLSSERQATIGKMAIRAVVTEESGGRLTFARATGRHFAKWLSALLFFVGFIMVAFTARKQGLHDLIAATVVVREPPTRP